MEVSKPVSLHDPMEEEEMILARISMNEKCQRPRHTCKGVLKPAPVKDLKEPGTGNTTVVHR